MPSTIEQIKQAILKRGGKASKHQIAREIKISLDYTNLILGELRRKGEIILSSGLYILTSLKKDDIQDTKEERPVRQSRKPRVAKKAKRPRVGKKPLYSLGSVLGISEPLERRLAESGYTTLESLADAPISILMGAAKLKIKEAAQLINQARERISR